MFRSYGQEAQRIGEIERRAESAGGLRRWFLEQRAAVAASAFDRQWDRDFRRPQHRAPEPMEVRVVRPDRWRRP